ncbi:MAG: tRNA (adenosine(37)-N6)-dimethylallyltransferase MiaA, partial [Treponema sp.]|nr:tRNA (adenosine(37)-N6)-dimethylallyltransferase MiaA [Treponema sp.]
PCNCVVLLGPTAVGKTAIGVRLAAALGGEIISADSRQVYKGLDIGSGKDLADYVLDGKQIPYHLIDVSDLSQEYSVFLYQKDFYKTFSDLQERAVLPVVVGGSGMYVDAVVRGYDLVPVPENKELRAELEKKSLEELGKMLLDLKGGSLHVPRDLLERERVVKAIEIESFVQSPECEAFKKSLPPRPDIRPIILGTTLPRDRLRANIARRLDQRLDEGMVEEVKGLHEEGASWERLEKLGLEYRFVSEFLQGKYSSQKEMRDLLCTAICQFAKRQETWFRGMEKKGVKINWLPLDGSVEEKVKAAMEIIAASGLKVKR